MSDGWRLPGLEPCERLVDDPDELYLRQVHPSYWDGYEIDLKAFETSSNDGHRLSGARSSVQTPEGAYRERLAMNRRSAGTWAVSVAQVVDQQSRVVDDAACPPPSEGWPVGHCYLDQRLPDKPQRRKLRMTLARYATLRGRLYPLVEQESRADC